MNGNVVLVPRGVRERVGTLDRRFQHNMSDMDYGFRAVKAGFEIVISPQAIGQCRKNATKGRWSDPTVPLDERIRAVLSFKGLPPTQWLRFTIRHTGWWWPRYSISPYLQAVFARRLRNRRSRATRIQNRAIGGDSEPSERSGDKLTCGLPQNRSTAPSSAPHVIAIASTGSCVVGALAIGPDTANDRWIAASLTSQKSISRQFEHTRQSQDQGRKPER